MSCQCTRKALILLVSETIFYSMFHPSSGSLWWEVGGNTSCFYTSNTKTCRWQNIKLFRWILSNRYHFILPCDISVWLAYIDAACAPPSPRQLQDFTLQYIHARVQGIEMTPGELSNLITFKPYVYKHSLCVLCMTLDLICHVVLWSMSCEYPCHYLLLCHYLFHHIFGQYLSWVV